MDRYQIVPRALWLARIPWLVGACLVRNARDHPHTIGYTDASAAALWPRVPEEADPPRWRIPAE